MAHKVYFGYLCPFVIDLQTFIHILVKVFDIKFHPNPSSGSRTLSCGPTAWRTDMTKLIVVFQIMLMRIEISKMTGTLYEGWNFNSGNYLFTTDTK